ncbi:MAG: transglutaminase domain-containing protein [Desulfobacterales bacterium]|nr:transglutaminase domain-containing protein [Desulfobacterales bacterium]
MENKKLRMPCLVAGCLIICILFILFFKLYKNLWFSPQPEQMYPIDRQVSYSFTIKNTTNRVIEKAEFWAYAPVKQTATQVCRKIKSSHEYDLITDSLGNQILHYIFNLIPPYGSKIITITADLKLSNKSNKIKTGDPKSFLKPEKYIEINHPDIIKAAEKLKTADTLEIVRKTFEWVSRNMVYSGYSGKSRGALYALKHKKGDCTEYMYLFAALCRANNIPARCVGGYICPGNSILKPSGFHNWAEIFHDGVWKNVDPQKKVFMENQSHYISTQIVDDFSEDSTKGFHRFRFKGRGLRVKMNG